MKIDKPFQKKIAFYVCDNDEKGRYPLRRARTIAQSLPTSMEIVFLGPSQYEKMLADWTFHPVANGQQLFTVLRKIQADILIRDSGSTTRDEVRKLSQVVPSTIHFDDFGEGGEFANFVIQTLYSEKFESNSPHYLIDYETFIADEQLLAFKGAGENNNHVQTMPHLVVTFGDKDSNNLTYRSLRHLLNLQIPLEITIVIGKEYRHHFSDIQMMALSRRHTNVVKESEHLYDILARADIVLCNASYMPYEISMMGIPCIVVAQNDFEASLDFPSTSNGFIHLGLGRKVKQSHLLNAIMEYVLHDDLRRLAIKKQLSLNIGNGLQTVREAILYCLQYPKKISLNEK